MPRGFLPLSFVSAFILRSYLRYHQLHRSQPERPWLFLPSTLLVGTKVPRAGPAYGRPSEADNTVKATSSRG